MKDFENDLIYYPNPDPVKEPRFILKSVDELEKSTKYSVTCNGIERVVYHTDSFDYVVVVDNEAYDLEISIHTPYEKLEIRPSSFGIVPFVKGETVHIHLDEPRKFTVETDGGLHDALFVLCSHRIEKPADTTICFEKGKVYNVGVLTLKSNDTVYIEEGAVVSGCVYADHCDNISIVGNGIINGACWHLPDSNADRFFIYAKWCNNVLLKGFTAVDGPSWHVVPAACDHVVIDDMNIGTGVIRAIAFQQIYCTPNAETGTQSHHQSLQNFHSRVKEFHSRFSFIIKTLQTIRTHLNPRIGTANCGGSWLTGVPLRPDKNKTVCPIRQAGENQHPPQQTHRWGGFLFSGEDIFQYQTYFGGRSRRSVYSLDAESNRTFHSKRGAHRAAAGCTFRHPAQQAHRGS